MKYLNLGHRISELRKEMELTQAELAQKIGVSRPVMVKIEKAQRVVSLDEGENISRAFGISIDTLMEFEKEQTEKRSFVQAFKSKGEVSLNQEKEIKRFEILFDALCTQEIIYRGE